MNLTDDELRQRILDLAEEISHPLCPDSRKDELMPEYDSCCKELRRRNIELAPGLKEMYLQLRAERTAATRRETPPEPPKATVEQPKTERARTPEPVQERQPEPPPKPPVVDPFYEDDEPKPTKTAVRDPFDD